MGIKPAVAGCAWRKCYITCCSQCADCLILHNFTRVICGTALHSKVPLTKSRKGVAQGKVRGKKSRYRTFFSWNPAKLDVGLKQSLAEPHFCKAHSGQTPACGRRSMVGLLLPKQITWVRFPSPAPVFQVKRPYRAFFVFVSYLMRVLACLAAHIQKRKSHPTVACWFRRSSLERIHAVFPFWRWVLRQHAQYFLGGAWVGQLSHDLLRRLEFWICGVWISHGYSLRVGC